MIGKSRSTTQADAIIKDGHKLGADLTEEESPMMSLFMHQVASALVRYFQGKKLLDTQAMIKSLIVNGIHIYVIDGMIGFDIPMVPEAVSEIILSALSMSALEWALDTYLKFGTPQKFMTYLIKNGLENVIVEGMRIVKDMMVEPASGSARIFG